MSKAIAPKARDRDDSRHASSRRHPLPSTELLAVDDIGATGYVRAVRLEVAMSEAVFMVRAAFDEEADVWFVESSDLHGVNAEAPTLDALVAKLPEVILDLLEDGDAAASAEIALDIVAHRRATVRRAA